MLVGVQTMMVVLLHMYSGFPTKIDGADDHDIIR